MHTASKCTFTCQICVRIFDRARLAKDRGLPSVRPSMVGSAVNQSIAFENPDKNHHEINVGDGDEGQPLVQYLSLYFAARLLLRGRTQTHSVWSRM